MRIVSFAAVRLVGLAVTLLVMSVIVYAGLYLAPGNPVAVLTGGRPLPHRTVAAIEAQYGFNKPFFLRYLDWLGQIVRGDFGKSIVFRENVSTLKIGRASCRERV